MIASYDSLTHQARSDEGFRRKGLSRKIEREREIKDRTETDDREKRNRKKGT